MSLRVGALLNALLDALLTLLILQDAGSSGVLEIMRWAQRVDAPVDMSSWIRGHA